MILNEENEKNGILPTIPDLNHTWLTTKPANNVTWNEESQPANFSFIKNGSFDMDAFMNAYKKGEIPQDQVHDILRKYNWSNLATTAPDGSYGNNEGVGLAGGSNGTRAPETYNTTDTPAVTAYNAYAAGESAGRAAGYKEGAGVFYNWLTDTPGAKEFCDKWGITPTVANVGTGVVGTLLVSLGAYGLAKLWKNYKAKHEAEAREDNNVR